MKSTLKTIDDKAFIRDALFTEMLDGIAFYYFETTKKSIDRKKFMTDYDVENIVEINDFGLNASISYTPLAVYKDCREEKRKVCTGI